LKWWVSLLEVKMGVRWGRELDEDDESEVAWLEGEAIAHLVDVR